MVEWHASLEIFALRASELFEWCTESRLSRHRRHVCGRNFGHSWLQKSIWFFGFGEQQRALRRNETSPVSMTVFLAQVWRPLSFQQVFGRRDCWATREFSKMLFNPAIDSSVVGFNANSNLFWAHSDQHLGKHPYFEGIVVLSRLCWERLCMSTLQELQDKVGKIRSSKSCWKMLKATVSQGRRPTEAKWNPGSISQRACHVACLWWEVNKHGWLWQVWRMRCLLTIFSEMLKEHPA